MRLRPCCCVTPKAKLRQALSELNFVGCDSPGVALLELVNCPRCDNSGWVVSDEVDAELNKAMVAQ